MEKEKKLWFKRRRYGWGWTPVTWQGWLAIIIYLLALFLGMEIIKKYSGVGEPVATYIFLGWVLVITAVLVIISLLKGPKPRMRWGSSIDDDPEVDY